MDEDRNPQDWLRYAEMVGIPSASNAASFPDFLVVSPSKTGTTWIAANLAQDTLIPPVKEVRYFERIWRKASIDWYCQLFDRPARQLAGDVSPTYALLPSFAIEHIRNIKPDLKIVFLLRHLPERAWSHLRHTHREREANFAEPPVRKGAIVGLDKQIENLTHDYLLSSSDYEGMIRRWAAHYPKEQIKISFFEEAVADPDRYFSQLRDFLGITRARRPPIIRTSINTGDGSRPAERLGEWLNEIYAGRQHSLDAYLHDAFGLRPPWPVLRSRPSDHAPLVLPHLAGEPQIKLENGLFSAVQRGSGQRIAARPDPRKAFRFMGDLRRTMDSQSFDHEGDLRAARVSLEDRRLICELDKLAFNAESAIAQLQAPQRASAAR